MFKNYYFFNENKRITRETKINYGKNNEDELQKDR